jgi:hypothetical protein
MTSQVKSVSNSVQGQNYSLSSPQASPPGSRNNSFLSLMSSPTNSVNIRKNSNSRAIAPNSSHLVSKDEQLEEVSSTQREPDTHHTFFPDPKRIYPMNAFHEFDELEEDLEFQQQKYDENLE